MSLDPVVFKKLKKKKLVAMLGPYYVVNVFQKVDEGISREIQKVYLTHRGLPRDVNWREAADQTCLLLLDDDGEIIALTSYRVATPGQIYGGEDTPYGRSDDKYFSCRLFVISTKSIPDSTRVMICHMYNVLRKESSRSYKGLITTLENRKYERPGTLKLFRRYGFEPLPDRSVDGKMVVVREFSQGKITL